MHVFGVYNTGEREGKTKQNTEEIMAELFPN